MARPPRTPNGDKRLNPTHPFTRAGARAAGIRITELRGPRFQKIFYDLYIAADVEVTAVVHAQAALKISPARSVASHYTAAEVWGGCVPNAPTHPCQCPGGRKSIRASGHPGSCRDRLGSDHPCTGGYA
ncbi:MAG: hypothetical protein WKF76_10085 [Nocardioidaceae bacterium]